MSNIALQAPTTIDDLLYRDIMAEVTNISEGSPSTSGPASVISAMIRDEMRKVITPSIAELSGVIDRVAARIMATYPSPVDEPVVRADEGSPDVTSSTETTVGVDPLDVAYDGVPLCDLIEADLQRRSAELDGCRSSPARRFAPTPSQRAALSACWSAQLRALVDQRAELERRRVKVDDQVDLADLMAPDAAPDVVIGQRIGIDRRGR